MIRTYKVMLQKAKEGGFTALVPSLPGCITEDHTVEEAISMAREAIELCVEKLKSRGEAVL